MARVLKRWWRSLVAVDRGVLRKLRGSVVTVGAFLLSLTIGVTALQAVTGQGAAAPTVAAVEIPAPLFDEAVPLIDFSGFPPVAPRTDDLLVTPAEVQATMAALAVTPTEPTAAPTEPVPTVAPPAPTATPAPAAPEPSPTPSPADTDLPQDFFLPEVSDEAATDLELRLLAGINAERLVAGLQPYVLDAGLTKLARIRTHQLADQGYFGHTDPFGYSMYVELLAYFEYSYAWAGENLALNNYAVSESPEHALTSLMESATHRANILADDFTVVGIGEYTLADGRHFYAMIFLS